MRQFLMMAALFMAAPLVAQTQPGNLALDALLFTVGGEAVSAGEFLYVYNKNKDISREIDPKSADEYMELYVNFKRKVMAAEALGRDTLPQFEREYNNYYRQLIKPYLTDRTSDDQLIEEAHGRMTEDVRASHIMVLLDENALPKDTAKAYKSIMQIKTLLDKGASFEELARTRSGDTYSAKSGGDLGWFTVFDMIYEFESAVYGAKEGDLVGPVRSSFGYHMILVTGRRPAHYQMEASHIFIPVKEGDDEGLAKNQIDEIHQKLEGGEPFEAMARIHSKDITSSGKGGKLKAFGLNEMLPEFEAAAFALEVDGAYTSPVRTSMGWHIIRRDAMHDIPSLERAYSQLKYKVGRDDRSKMSQSIYLARLARTYDLQKDAKAIDQVVQAIYKGRKTKRMKKEIFSFAQHPEISSERYTFTQRDFAEIVKGGDLSEAAIYKNLENVINSKLLHEAEVRLPYENAQFRYLAKEYREGILVFDLMRDMVWDHASDSVHLHDYFTAHQAKYQWNDRVMGYILRFDSKTKARRALRLLGDNVPVSKVQEMLLKKDPLALQADEIGIELGRGELNDKEQYFMSNLPSERISPILRNGDRQYVLVVVEQRVPPGPKALEDCRGQAIADFQHARELEWMTELEEVYPLELNQEMWNILKEEHLD